MKKILLSIILISGILFSIQIIYATVQDPGEIGSGWVDTDIENALGGTWANVSIVIQILAIGCLVYAGLRYMFASADQRADVKHGMKNLAIGAVLVFVTIPVIRFVTISVETLIDPTVSFIEVNGQDEVFSPVRGSSIQQIKNGNPKDGDMILAEDYIYVYNKECYLNNGTEKLWKSVGGSAGGWGVKVRDETKTSYSNMPDRIYGVPVIYVSYAYANCINLIEAPKISGYAVYGEGMFFNCSSLTTAPSFPRSLVYLDSAFADCTSLTTVGEIKGAVKDINQMFCNCTKLSGDVYINITSELEYFAGVFMGTVKSIKVTSVGNQNTPDRIKIDAKNKNVTIIK